jgi:uncharacterized repeat protein (TIGR02543 family)
MNNVQTHNAPIPHLVTTRGRQSAHRSAGSPAARSGFWRRIALVGCLVLTGAHALAQTAGTVTVRASASLANNVGPQMELRVNGSLVGSTEVRAATPQNYSFANVTVPAGAKVELVFNNDAFSNDGDRNLYVDAITVNGVTIASTAPGVVFDRGPGAQAFDGLDVMPGLSTLFWNGALRFTAGTATPPAPPSPVDTPPAGYTLCAKEGQRCSFSGTADVVYGARSTWTKPRSFSSSTACTNAVFGDPLRGVVKSCYMKPVVTAPTQLGLNLTISGTGGVGFSDGSSCSASCAKSFNSGSAVTLAAAPSAGYTFAGWSGACSGTSSTCTVTMDAAKTVAATFSASPTTLTVSVSGSGSVSSTPSGINCGSSCSAPFALGSQVTLTATPAAGFTFTGWSGACTGTSACSVTLSASANVAAAFATLPPPPPPPPATTSQTEAARFLTQATYGPNMAEIQRVANIGPAAWIDQQFNTPSMDSHWEYAIVRKGPPGCTVCQAMYVNAVMESFWMQAVQGQDQLRQRTVLALSEIFVISTVNSQIEISTDAHASYLDMLSRNAFGNFRQLLEQVATHPAMGKYLSHFANEREDAATGRIPDENFAREVMQLFSIGLWQLNPDGTRRRDGNNNFIPTYIQADVSGLARVFTGWSWNGPDKSYGRWKGWGNTENWRDQMQNYPEFHSTSEKRFLGVTIPANTSGEQSLRIALDTMFNHPNVGPFIGRQLIQRFVTSNPSPAYVGRVAAAFNNNGQGVRGDMRAVLRAVLLDWEARDPNTSNQATWGKLREPMIRFGNWMRAFDARPSNGVYAIWNLENPVESLGQNPLRAPSVFNWFRPDYAPPGPVLNQGLVAPEFQITHETTVTGYANFVAGNVQKSVGSGHTGVLANYASELPLAGNPAALMDRLNLLLTAGRMTSATRQTIINAVNEVPASQANLRVAMAVALTMISPEFIVQK